MKVLAALLFPILLSATVSTSSSTAQLQGVSTWSFNHTCAAGDHVLLNVMVVGETGNPGASRNPTSITFTVVATGAAVPLTKFATDGSVSFRTNEIWQLLGCPSGVAGSITVTLSAAVQASFGVVRAAAISVSNADYLTSLSFNGNSHEEQLGGTNLSSYSLTTTRANEVVISAGVATASGAFSGFLGTAEVFNNAPASTGTNYAVGYLNAGAAGAKTVGWSGAPALQVSNLSLSIRPWAGFTSAGILSRAIDGVPIQTQTGTAVVDANMGDTQITSGGWATSSLAAGSFNGGAVFISANDGAGTTTGCPASYQLCIFKMTNYVTGTPTWAAGPNLTAYGTSGGLGCPGSPTRDARSRSPFVFKGKLYLLYGCTDASFLWYDTGILAIPDGIHTCNWVTWQTGGNAGPNSCDAGNWKTTGDKGSSLSVFQWPSVTSSPPLTALTIISMGCQDNATTCAVAPGLDPAYVYFIGFTAAARFPKSAADPMDPSIWTYRQGDGSWTNVLATAASYTPPTGGVAGGGVTWDRYHGVFVGTGADKHGVSTTPLPWGPWTNHPPSSSANYQFESMLDPLLTTSAGRVTGVISLNTSTGFIYTLESIDLGPVNPTRVQ